MLKVLRGTIPELQKEALQRLVRPGVVSIGAGLAKGAMPRTREQPSEQDTPQPAQAEILSIQYGGWRAYQATRSRR
jgi:hypothetical protein